MRQPPAWEPAIIAGGLDYGDSDRIVRMLTPSFGRVAALARKARASRRRFGGALDTGNRIDAALRPGHGDLWHLDEATLVDGRLGARQDLSKLANLAYACEACFELSRENHPEPRLFGLLDTAGLLLDGATDPPADLFRLGLEAKALTFAGLAPALDRCAACGEPPDEPMTFQPEGGGALHARCDAAGGTPVSLAWLAALERARRTPLRDLLDERAPDGPDHALSDAIAAHLGRPLKSRAILDQLCGLPGARLHSAP